MGANEQQQPAIRTQYAYVQSTTAPPQLSVPATAMSSGSDHSLSIPRYVDNNARPTKSPRHGAHQSVHSAGSLTTNDASEYRYGTSYVGVNHNTHNNMTPSAYSAGDNGSAGHAQPPSREYYPPATSWASEPSSTVHAYHNADNRSYTYSDQYKTGHAMPPLKTEQSHAQASYGGSLNHYNWSPT